MARPMLNSGGVRLRRLAANPRHGVNASIATSPYINPGHCLIAQSTSPSGMHAAFPVFQCTLDVESISFISGGQNASEWAGRGVSLLEGCLNFLGTQREAGYQKYKEVVQSLQTITSVMPGYACMPARTNLAKTTTAADFPRYGIRTLEHYIATKSQMHASGKCHTWTTLTSLICQDPTVLPG